MEMLKLEDPEEIEVKLQGIAGKAQELRHSLTKFTGAYVYVTTGSDPEAVQESVDTPSQEGETSSTPS
jgi:hypothetical protein